ncbi:DBH-like monooxygenase protein 1 [Hyalella azteca]|uniref:DBH-like monooxygenase protein 1 n=1 Tax=Hyalella azteca TaxID=294128 RepID=A0A8B7N864_HYAAZ|nr:DBH-like monooxygenase protein 1 [Hyalella azteca]
MTTRGAMFAAVLSLLLGASMGLSAGDVIRNAAQLDDQGKFFMAWTAETEHVTFEIQVATLGYAGLGFSPSGGMQGADIILGWVDDSGEAHLHDMHGVGNSPPVEDPSQDMVLMEGRRNDTHTTLRFRRPWVTCDSSHDMALSSDTVKVIFAYDQERPVNLSNLQHHDYRGVRSLYLQEPRMEAPLKTEDVKHWDVQVNNFLVPSQVPSTYWCTIKKFPGTTEKHHYIGAEPIFSPESHKDLIHHMILYECFVANSSRVFERYVELQGTRCYTNRMPSLFNNCARPIVAWAVGAETQSLPAHVGGRLGEKWGGADYFMMEIHYENQAKINGTRDNSGLRLFYTPKLRKYDASLLDVSHAVGAELLIPPLAPTWPAYGHCSSECTRATIPPTGINVVAGFLHSHLLGRAIALLHIRNGTELPPIFSDNAYSFKYQQFHQLKQEVTILPGDHLTTVCSYNSSGRIHPTFGGLRTQDEMCSISLLYYPSMALSTCSSVPFFEEILKSVGVTSLYEERSPSPITKKALDALDEERFEFMKLGAEKAIGENSGLDFNRYRAIKIKEPYGLQNLTLYDHLNERNFWISGKWQDKLRLLQTSHYVQLTCSDGAQVQLAKFSPVLTVPEFEPYSPPQQPCTDAAGQRTPQPLHAH